MDAVTLCFKCDSIPHGNSSVSAVFGSAAGLGNDSKIARANVTNRAERITSNYKLLVYGRVEKMLQQLSEQVRECHEQADDAKTRAEETTDPVLRKAYLDLEERWLFLARSQMFGERLEDFIDKRLRRNEYAPADVKLPVVGQLFDLLPIAIYVCDASGLIIYYNRQAAKLWGRSPQLNDPTDRFCGSYRMYHLDGGPIAHPECPMADALRIGIPVRDREIVIERSDGSRGVALVNIDPFKDDAGKVLGAVNCFQDVTERKHKERQVATLAREAEHRVKNILTTVQATVSLSRSDSVAGLKQAIEGRIKALADVHGLFVRSRWQGADLTRIAAQELAPYLQESKPRVLIEGPVLVLEPSIAQVLAMALHELATNAAKYGALSTREGYVELKWASTAEGQLNVRWRERGGPPLTKPTFQGFGTGMIRRVIQQQAKGEMRLDWDNAGLGCEILLPLDAPASATKALPL